MNTNWLLCLSSYFVHRIYYTVSGWLYFKLLLPIRNIIIFFLSFLICMNTGLFDVETEHRQDFSLKGVKWWWKTYDLWVGGIAIQKISLRLISISFPALLMTVGCTKISRPPLLPSSPFLFNSLFCEKNLSRLRPCG